MDGFAVGIVASGLVAAGSMIVITKWLRKREILAEKRAKTARVLTVGHMIYDQRLIPADLMYKSDVVFPEGTRFVMHNADGWQWKCYVSMEVSDQKGEFASVPYGHTVTVVLVKSADLNRGFFASEEAAVADMEEYLTYQARNASAVWKSV